MTGKVPEIGDIKVLSQMTGISEKKLSKMSPEERAELAEKLSTQELTPVENSQLPGECLEVPAQESWLGRVWNGVKEGFQSAWNKTPKGVKYAAAAVLGIGAVAVAGPAIVASGLMMGLVEALGKAIPNFATTDWYGFLDMIANTAFMGYPVNLGIFGYDGFLRAIFCDIATMCIFLILSFVLVIKFGGTVKKAIRKIALFPPLWAIIFGLGLNILNIPIGPVLDNVVHYLGDGAIPLIMISLGLSIDLSGLSRSKAMVGFTSVMKLLFFPLVAFVVASFLGLLNLEFTVSIVEAAMPSGMLSLVLAITYKLDYELTSDCILINTVISLITLPIIIMIL